MPGVENKLFADALSHFHWQEVNSCAQQLTEGLDLPSLEAWCQQFLAEGIAPTTRTAYASRQKRFVDFCWQTRRLAPHNSPCPADKWTLCLFVTHLAASGQPFAIKVYLSAVQDLHIEQDFSDLLVNCFSEDTHLSVVDVAVDSS